MDETELNPTGSDIPGLDTLDPERFNQPTNEYLEQRESEEEVVLPEDQGVPEDEIVSEDVADSIQNEYIVDGDDLRNHPQYEYLRLDIPWSEEEAKGDYPLEVYDRKGRRGDAPDGNVDVIDNAYSIWLARKHALTEGGDPGLEIANNIKSGGLSLISSVLTAPERAYDMMSGEMKNEDGVLIDSKTGQPYKPDWDPMGQLDDPWTNSYWGGLLKNVTHYGIGGAWAARGLGALGISGGIGRIMLAEGAVAAVSEYSQGDNFTGMLVEKFPWTEPVLGAIATDDDDHPLLLTFKNVVEEMGIPGVVDKLFFRFGKGQKALNRAKNTDTQIIEKGKIELAEGIANDAIVRVNVEDITDQKLLPPSGFRGHKNKVHGIADPWQGAPASTGKPLDIYEQLNRIDEGTGGSGSTLGGTDSVMTPAQAERGASTSGYAPKFLKQKAKELLGDTRLNDLIEEAKRNQLTFDEVFRPAYARFQEVMGRHATATDVEDFWKPIIKDEPFQTGAGASTPNYQAWSMENVVVADLVNGALFKQLRDSAIAAREINNIADVFVTDGPMKTIQDRLIFGLSNVKRSRYLISTEFSKLKGPGGTATARSSAAAKKRIAQLHKESEDGVKLMMQMLKNNSSEELANGILEVFSMSNKIQNWMDFDAWMRQKIVGGEFDGKVKTGALIRELQGVMVNSILSGPKTPLRAIMGTTANSFLNSFNTLVGAIARQPFTTDVKLSQAAAHNFVGMFEILPDAAKVFRRNVESYFSGDMATIKTRYSKSVKQDNWELYGHHVENRLAQDMGKNWAEVLAYRIANTAHGLNNNVLLSWSPRVLAATDDTFRYILAKARAKEQGFKAAFDAVEGGRFKEITPELMRHAEDLEYNKLLDADGNIDLTKDIFLEKNFKEVTLTKDLQGFSKKVETLFNSVPWAKPFFLFARTGVNGIILSAKNTPLLGALVDESRAILWAKAGDIKSGKLLKYGIENADDLKQAQNLIIGRQIVGNAIVMMAYQKYLAGELTGNGPADGALKQNWIDTGWERNTITLGGIRVGTDTLEPYNMILSAIADIGDNSRLMGPEWTENKSRVLALAVGAGITNKTYLQGIGQLVDLLSGRPSSSTGKVIGNIMNNTVPLAGARNAIGNFLNPYMRELSKDTFDHIRNRNKASEYIASEQLPIKYDILNGQPLKDHNFIEAAWNAVSPVNLSLKAGPGRTLLWNSNYDMRLSVMSSPTSPSISLKDEPLIRSLFQQAIGKQNLEAQLDALAERPDVQASVKTMNDDLKRGEDHLNPNKAYLHNDLIHSLFTKARRRAWASLRTHPEVIRITNEQKELRRQTYKKRQETKSPNLLKKKQMEQLLALPSK